MKIQHDQAKSIFLSAVEIASTEERRAFVVAQCAGNDALRAEVEEFLKHHEGLGAFLQDAPPGLCCDSEAAFPNALEGPGTLIGPYKLLEQIGEGGFGLVFMAKQQQPMRRKVAVKVLKPGMDTRQVIARFEAERQALALMDHPNIAQIHDGGETASGRPYFVMELVKGTPITDYCDRSQVAIRARLELFLQVCQAVQHAHHKGIIHRDLKPSNVLVALHDGTPVVKVIDFGIAKAMGTQLTDKTLFTGFAQMVGTPLYMSPEQAGQSSIDVDTRSDIYALGVLLYELLMGTTPFDKERLKLVSYDELRRIIREEEPPKPSRRLSTLGQAATTVSARRQSDPRGLSRLLVGELDWVVMKALEKDRNRRYETASAFAADVQRYLHDEPVLACPPSTWYRLRKFVRRNQAGLWTLAAVLLVGLLAAGSIGWALWDRAAQQETQRTELAVRRAKTERTISVALARAELLAEQAHKMPSATSGEGKAALAVWQQADDTQAQAVSALNTGAADDELRQRVTAVREQLQRGRQQTERALARALRKEKLFRDLDEARMARAVWVDSHFDHAVAAEKYAAAFVAYGLIVTPHRLDELARRLGAEETDVREALLVALDDWADAASRAPTKWSARDLWALAEAADNDKWRKRYRAAVVAGDGAALRELSAAAQRSFLPPSSLVLLARSLDWRDERDECLALLRWGRSRHPTDFWLHFELGFRLRGEKGGTPVEVEEAIGCYRAALALRPKAIAIHNNLGSALQSKNQWAEAIAAYRQAIQLDPKFAYAHTGLGSALRSTNQWAEAIAEFRLAIQLDPKLAQAHNNLGSALWATNQWAEAIAAYRQAIKSDPKFAQAHNNLGNALWATNQPDEAVAAYRQAIAIDPRYASPHNNLGCTLLARSQWDEAIAEFRLAIQIDPKYTDAHTNLGSALLAKNQLDEAIAEFRLAIQFNPRHANAHFNLGCALRAKNQLDEAIAEFRLAIQFNPRHADAHRNLGFALQVTNQWDEAIAAFRQAIQLDPKLAQAHAGLGGALVMKGRFAEAKTFALQALELLPEKHPLRPIVLSRLEQLARLLALEAKLPDVLAGKVSPTDNGERLDLIEVCHLQRRTVAAARLYADAFAADAKLADDLKALHRSKAACAAALAAAGQGTDAAKLDAHQRVRLRQQALVWLRADLDLWGQRLADGQPAERPAIHANLQHWLRGADLASVREAAALASLPAEERQAWTTLWAEVDKLSRATAKKDN